MLCLHSSNKHVQFAKYKCGSLQESPIRACLVYHDSFIFWHYVGAAMNSKESVVENCSIEADTSNFPENVCPDSNFDENVLSCTEESDSEHEEYWDVDAAELNQDFNLDEDDPSIADDSTTRLITVTTLFLLLWASFYAISASALQHLIKFLCYIFSTLKVNTPDFADDFPSSLYMLKKRFGILNDKFKKYVVCPKCNSLYEYKECISKSTTGVLTPKSCIHIAFRNHPHVSRRQPCGHRLLKEVITKTEKKYYPIKCYCYNSIRNSLQLLLQSNNLLNECESWRDRSIPDEMLADVYDGKVWQDFQVYKGRPFLSRPHNIALLLNCDWFQPYKHSQYSVGVLYLIILNLPRSVRFKPENVIIAGIIPGPSEPNYNEINSYLRPLVKELNSLWEEGFTIKHQRNTLTCYAALLGSVCDIPATYKLGGFVGYLSHHACLKCKKIFPTNEELNRVDFSGVDIGITKTHEEHKQNALNTLNALTQSSKDSLELECGSRFTQLMLLPYYDCIRFAIIDPMHNLFLGSAKRIMQKQWLDMFTNTDLNVIQQRVDSCMYAGTIGRIPRKITSSFSSLTADEWKNWTLIFSLISLFDILPPDHLSCWKYFVAACKIYSSSVISLLEIDKAHEFMCKFFVAAEQLYGPRFLTINSHLHLHLSSCYKDYGPCYGFWLFSFERYNGLLGKYHTNQLSVEIQIMRQFVNDMSVRNSYVDSVTLNNEEQALFGQLIRTGSGGTSCETLYNQQSRLQLGGRLQTILSLSEVDVNPSIDYFDNNAVKLLPPSVVHYFDSDELRYLQQSYAKFIPGLNVFEVPKTYRKHKAAEWWSQHLETEKRGKSTCIRAYWIGENGNITQNAVDLSAGEIVYFFSQNVKIEEQFVEILMVKVRWFQEHQYRSLDQIEPVEVWCNELYKLQGPASYMPLIRVHDVCATCVISIDRENVLLVNPVRRKLFL